MAAVAELVEERGDELEKIIERYTVERSIYPYYKGLLWKMIFADEKDEVVAEHGYESNYAALGPDLLPRSIAKKIHDAGIAGTMRSLCEKHSPITGKFTSSEPVICNELEEYFGGTYVWHYFAFFNTEKTIEKLTVTLSPETFEERTAGAITNFDREIIAGLSSKHGSRGVFYMYDLLCRKKYGEENVLYGSGFYDSINRHSLTWSKRDLIIAIVQHLGRIPTYVDLGNPVYSKVDEENCVECPLPGFLYQYYQKYGHEAYIKHIQSLKCPSTRTYAYFETLYRIFLRVYDHWDWEKIHHENKYTIEYLQWVGEYIYELPFATTYTRDELIDQIKSCCK